jgi:hypothetical protein
MIDQHQINAWGEKLSADSNDAARDLTARGRAHLAYLDNLISAGEQFVAMARRQRERFAQYEERPVEQLPQRRLAPRIAEQTGS